MSQRRAANRHALTKATTYSIGVFSVTTDLRAMVEAFGLERTTELATALNHELARKKHRSTAKPYNGRKIASDRNAVIANQITQNVARNLEHYRALNNKPTKKVA